MPIRRFYLINALDDSKVKTILKDLQKLHENIHNIKTERCFHVELIEGHTLSKEDEYKLRWILKNTQENDNLTNQPSLSASSNGNECMIEIGPRFNFSTADSTNSVSICRSIHLDYIVRIETSIRYLITLNGKSKSFSSDEEAIIVDHLSDRMTECRYTDENIPKNSFNERLPKEKESWFCVPVLKHGREALQEVNSKMGLAFDNWDLDYYTDLFTNILKRDPTSVELFDLAQSNSEHSRHWFFKGRMIVDGKEEEKSLIKMIIETQNHSNQNNTIKFSDNSSAIKGFKCKTLHPTTFIEAGKMQVSETELDLIFTAETHNMPTTVAPFPGATTGTGGRIRDVQGVGRGGHTIAGTAGYCVGILNIPDYNMPYEDHSLQYPPSFASPLKIIIEASNGASDYGNKFGEPVLTGFAISYGVINAQNERDEYVKSIMFSGGLGTMDSTQTQKLNPEKGMLLAKIGGPVYRIGVGGGAASSVEVQGDNKCELDFNAVQRGDAEMENKLNRVVRSCIEMGDENPILAIHDQGAGGNGNVLKELVEPGYAGAVIFSKEFQLGDPTINALELWGAEYQENNAILCKPESRSLLEAICERERCPINFVGAVTGNGNVTLIEDEAADFKNFMDRENIPKDVPFDMNLKYVLGEMPQKIYDMQRQKKTFAPLRLPVDDNHFQNYLDRVLSILSVGSKRFLTNKVDRCVTGLIVQQQCVGPLHTPLADYALTLVSHFEKKGIATSIGTQPIKGLISAESGARMSVAEALSNLVFVKITELADVKCSGNWMWAAKLPGEGAKMVDACKSMCSMMEKLNIAVDGGKDSLSMAARINSETVKSPGTLVISTYAPCEDVIVRITPDLKAPSFGKSGELIWVNIERKFRLGASALAQSLKQQGNDCPDLENVEALKAAFNVTQKLLERKVLLAGHDISDGGLIVCLTEMAISGLSGIDVNLGDAINAFGLEESLIENVLRLLFAEECGWVLECDSNNLQTILDEFKLNNVSALHIGKSTGFGIQSRIKISSNSTTLIDMSVLEAIKKWERTSYELEKLQMNPECAEEEYQSFDTRTGPKYMLTFNPDAALLQSPNNQWRVAVVREEGVNGDREMIAALIKANFEVHDVTMSDLLSRKAFLDNYRGVIFPGGFSYADTLGSAKGWAASIRFNDLLKSQFENFKNRKDTFSLGVCNGCQLMSMIGWVDDSSKESTADDGVQPIALLHNKSGRFECRWSSVKIGTSNAMMLSKMQGSVLGCWVAHGEGRFSFKNQAVLKNLKASSSIAMYYVDDDSQPTEKYPMNPNGSIEGIAAICSKDGRHLAMMPHPERCVEMFQWPYISPDFNTQMCPWQSMFNEAYNWCCEK